ncbi:MAG TPA: BrnA antitoxin family protein [Roseiarcus sp.]|nr:BrnA antitoxin family protein [Roseiarcus sp.]
MAKKKSDAATRLDDENPEWTRDEIKRALPALDAIDAVFGPKAADSLRRRRGRPAKPDRKINQTLRLDADVLDAYRQEGKGWQTRINQVLRENMHDRRK